MESVELPPVIYSQQGHNVTALLGETVELRCTVLGFRSDSHSVSWTRTTPDHHNPTALTFGDKVSRNCVSVRDVLCSGLHILQQDLCLQGAAGHLGVEAGQDQACRRWQLLLSCQSEQLTHQTVLNSLCAGYLTKLHDHSHKPSSQCPS